MGQNKVKILFEKDFELVSIYVLFKLGLNIFETIVVGNWQ